MKKIALDEMKRIQVDILKDVHQFCIENNIHYTLIFGTLLGAIRHKGYIPWDDDIDIAMMRPDYEKFVASYKHKEGWYHVYDFRKDKLTHAPFLKKTCPQKISGSTLTYSPSTTCSTPKKNVGISSSRSTS